MPEIIELARFRVRSGEEQEFLARRPDMVAAAKKHLPGLLRIELVELDNGEWIDIVHWKDRASAEGAPQLAEAVPEFAEWLAHIEEDTGMDIGVVHDRLTAVDAVDRNAGAPPS